MPLRLKLTVKTSIPLEVEGLTPDVVREKSLAEIERFDIFHGNQQLPLGEFFQVTGDAADERFEFAGDLSGVHWIGAKMAAGEIRVEGPAGRHVGSEMTGGAIHVAGDAGDWVGGEMHGGLIHVRGRAGHLVGAAYRGSARGMTGGTILIGGDAGNEIGHTMRRGLIAVGGGAGDFPAFNMIAGNVLICGPCGIRPAAGMRRGTLVLLSDEHPALLPTFRSSGRCRPQFMAVYLKHLRSLDFALPADYRVAEYLLYTGDLLTVGRGEILLRAA